ncbi:DUF1963 domain-containing protein [Micromonospora sp. NPDC006431]|uniref:DUF1963 domain-containing protein n=1 Tax=Micromonospora sp. NPDC006431 TaxID=3364235 RepID=UPI00369C03F8
MYREAPMLLLAQVDCAQTAAILGAEWPFPRQGYLLFFHDDEFSATYDYEQGDGGCRVLHLPAGSGAEAVATIPALTLDATLMPSLPNLRDDADKALGIHIVELIDLLEEHRPLLPAPRHRLLGYCDTDTSHPPGHRPLLQLEAERGTAWGEIVNVSSADTTRLACSIVIGEGITDETPGTQEIQAVVADAEATRRQLLDAGVDASEVEVQPWGNFVYFGDPDGNRWSLQAIESRPQRLIDGPQQPWQRTDSSRSARDAAS